MLGTFLLLCLATAVMAQRPHPCKTPMQWEGDEHSYDPDRHRQRWARIFYDETNRRVREIEKVMYPDQNMVFDVLFLHNENVMYSMDLKTRECNRSSISRPFFPWGVPPSANYTGTITLGAAGMANEYIMVNVFTGVQDNVEYTITTSSPDCYPLTAGHSLRVMNSSHVHEHREFFDIVPGISDPMAFVPPEECRKLDDQ